jgi:hypothetical protein
MSSPLFLDFPSSHKLQQVVGHFPSTISNLPTFGIQMLDILSRTVPEFFIVTIMKLDIFSSTILDLLTVIVYTLEIGLFISIVRAVHILLQMIFELLMTIKTLNIPLSTISLLFTIIVKALDILLCKISYLFIVNDRILDILVKIFSELLVIIFKISDILLHTIP